jgi:hypothetical protein
MGKKSKLKALRKMANALMPAINVATHEKHIYTGAEILAWNTITEIDGEKIDPEKKYLYHEPVFMVQNNRRRMKRAFVRNGFEGVQHLLNTTLAVVKADS